MLSEGDRFVLSADFCLPWSESPIALAGSTGLVERFNIYGSDYVQVSYDRPAKLRYAPLALLTKLV